MRSLVLLIKASALTRAPSLVVRLAEFRHSLHLFLSLLLILSLTTRLSVSGSGGCLLLGVVAGPHAHVLHNCAIDGGAHAIAYLILPALLVPNEEYYLRAHDETENAPNDGLAHAVLLKELAFAQSFLFLFHRVRDGAGDLIGKINHVFERVAAGRRLRREHRADGVVDVFPLQIPLISDVVNRHARVQVNSKLDLRHAIIVEQLVITVFIARPFKGLLHARLYDFFVDPQIAHLLFGAFKIGQLFLARGAVLAEVDHVVKALAHGLALVH
mmetsp:Transcript_4069/g.4974  ORF Transcript_4069/g.4974 Transcript_4069/m.4974 type:complete len:271 (-) Transcript_4069:896-1708(-)